MRILITGGSGFIGTNLIERLATSGASILDYSLHPPLKTEHAQYWRAGDILDRDDMVTAFQEFQPERVIHLAARADCDENTSLEEGYPVNVEGTRNVLDAVRQVSSVQHLIVTSSQFVCAPGRLPLHDQDYFPETIYGQSKVITEQLTRKANLAARWTIVRPTNVWGPWHLRYRREFWRILKRGLYLHPGSAPVIRSYGYVGNVVHQMQSIFEAPANQVHGQTLYLGDRPLCLRDWVDGFSEALTGRKARVLPRPVFRLLALAGDIPTTIFRKPFFINSSRYRSMITDYTTPMDRTFAILGETPVSMEAGIAETVKWLRGYNGADRLSGGS